MTQTDLSARVVLVTGGGWNIGRAIARRLAGCGARLALMGRNEARLGETKALIEAAGGQAVCAPADVTDAQAVVEAVARLRASLGAPDALVCCAGGGGAHAPLEEADPAEWWGVVQKNLQGTFHSIRAVLGDMRAQDRGDILTMSGGGAFFPVLGSHYSAYAASKAAICRLTDQLQAELLDTQINVNCVEPGMVWDEYKLAAIAAEEERSGKPHPLRPNNRAPEDAAELVEMLLSPAGRPIRGRVVSVLDGWWRDPAQIAAVEQTVHRYRVRRVED